VKGQTIELIPIVFIALFIFTYVYSPTDSVPQPVIEVSGDFSANWAGYAVVGESLENVEGSWIVPEVECPSMGDYTSAFWVGMDGFTSDTVEQIGTGTDCFMGMPIYYAWYEFYPKNSVMIDMGIAPGDVMHASVRFEDGYFILTLTDVTTNESFSVTEEADAERSSAEWIAEAPLVQNGRIMNLAPFGTVEFFNASATVNGTKGSLGELYSFPIIMRSGGIVKALPSELTESGFSVGWYHK
jgi:hypothetical protein